MTNPKSDAIAGDLYGLLCRKLPVCCPAGGTLQVALLAERLKMSPEGVYRWLRSDEISKRGRTRLLDLGTSAENTALLASDTYPLSEDDLRPFI